MRTVIRATCAALLVAANACFNDSEPEDNRADEWTVEPVLRIGNEADPETALSYLADVTTDSLGQIYVTQWNVAHVTVFDSTGQFVRALGRSGPGPGEFSSPSYLGWRQDTLWVLDSQAGRLVFYTTDGDHVRDLGFVVPPSSRGERALVPLRPLVDGSVLAGMGGLPISQVLRGQLKVEPLVRISPDGQLLNELVELPLRSGDYFQANLPSGGALIGRHPLPFGPLWTLSAKGDQLLVLERGVLSSDSAFYNLTSIDFGGDTLWTRTYQSAARPLAGWPDRWMAREAEAISSSGRYPRAAVERAFRESIAFSDFFPPAGDLLAGRDGTIWVRREEVDSAVTWEVLAPGGNPIAEVSLPEGWKLLEASRQEVWVEARGELDVPRLIRAEVRDGSKVPKGDA